MIGFCKDCGKPLRRDGACPDACGEAQASAGLRPSHDGLLVATATPASVRPPIAIVRVAGPFPKASTFRRLLGSGVEYVVYVVCVGLVVAMDLATLGAAALSALLPIGLIALRDCNAGAFSLAKRISHMRVIAMRSGQSASNSQALFRNSYYLGLLLLATILPWFSWLFSIFFTAFVALDVLMILASPQGRRLGDMLADTQVVEARS